MLRCHKGQQYHKHSFVNRWQSYCVVECCNWRIWLTRLSYPVFNFLLKDVCVCAVWLVFSLSVAPIELEWAGFSFSTAQYKSHYTSEWMIAFGSLESALAIFYWIELLILNVRLLPCNMLFSFDSILAYNNSIKCPCVCSDSPPLASAARLWLQSFDQEWRDLKQLKLSRQPTATGCFLILFLWVYKRQGLSSPDLSFISNLSTVSQSFISFPLSCGTYLATSIYSVLSLSILPYIQLKKM